MSSFYILKIFSVDRVKTQRYFFPFFYLFCPQAVLRQCQKKKKKRSSSEYVCPLPLSGFRQRRRDVLWESDSSLEGTCPHLLESVPCDQPACYLWQVQQEGRCIPAKGPCGSGTAVRNVTCVNTEGNERPRMASGGT